MPTDDFVESNEDILTGTFPAANNAQHISYTTLQAPTNPRETVHVVETVLPPTPPPIDPDGLAERVAVKLRTNQAPPITEDGIVQGVAEKLSRLGTSFSAKGQQTVDKRAIQLTSLETKYNKVFSLFKDLEKSSQTQGARIAVEEMYVSSIFVWAAMSSLDRLEKASDRYSDSARTFFDRKSSVRTTMKKYFKAASNSYGDLLTKVEGLKNDNKNLYKKLYQDSGSETEHAGVKVIIDAVTEWRSVSNTNDVEDFCKFCGLSL